MFYNKSGPSYEFYQVQKTTPKMWLLLFVVVAELILDELYPPEPEAEDQDSS